MGRSERQHLAAPEKRDNTKQDLRDRFYYVVMGVKARSLFLCQITVKTVNLYP